MAENHIHSFTKTVIPSTCKEHGYTLYKCECGYEHKSTFTPLIEHNFELISETELSCTKAQEKTFCCSVCGEKKTETSPAYHEWGPWTVRRFPTCTEKGLKVSVCTRCGLNVENEMPEIGHKLKYPKKSKTEKGIIDYFCENCGRTISLPTTKKKISSFFSKNKKTFITAFLSLIAFIIASVVGGYFLSPIITYNSAQRMIRQENYELAYKAFKSLGDYKDSKEQLERFFTKYKTAYRSTTQFFLGDTTDFIKTEYEICYTYDKYGNILTQTETNLSTNESFSFKYEYVYSEDGKKLEEKMYYNSFELLSRIEYSYEENGCIFTKEFSPENVLLREYRTNQFGLLSGSVTYNDDGTVKSRYEYTYEATFFNNGKPKEVTLYLEPDDSVSSEKKEAFKYYEFDIEGNLVLEQDLADIYCSSIQSYKYKDPEYFYKK